MAKITYMLHEISPEISDQGGFFGTLAGRDTFGTSEVITEAIEKGYVTQRAGVVQQCVEGVMQSMVDGSSKDGNNRRIDGFLLIAPYLKGRFERKDSAFNPAVNSIVLNARLLKEMKVNTRNWTLHNAISGILMKTTGVCTVGKVDAGRLTRGSDFTIVGQGLKLVPDAGDKVTWSCKLEDGTTATGEVTVSNSSDLTILCAWPAGLTDEFVGKTVEFHVTSHAGDAEATRQTDNVSAVILASDGGSGGGDTPGPEPTPELTLTSIQTTGVQEGQVNETNTTSIRGQDNLYPWDSERDSVVVHFDGQELTVPDVEFSAGNETLQFQIPQRVGEVLNDDDTLSFTVTINGAVGTIDAVWKH